MRLSGPRRFWFPRWRDESGLRKMSKASLDVAKRGGIRSGGVVECFNRQSLSVWSCRTKLRNVVRKRESPELR